MKVSDAPPPAKGQPNDQPAAGGEVFLSREQFARIEELLLPGYELAKWYLNDMAEQRAAANAVPVDPMDQDFVEKPV